MNLVLVRVLVTLPAPPGPAYVRTAAHSFKHSPPVVAHFVREICFLHSFLSQPAHRSARAPRSFTRSCTSYTRSLTCHNLLFRHLPFSRQPTHSSTRTQESVAIYTRPRPLPIRTHCPLCKTHSSPLGFDYSTPILGFLPCAFPTTWRARLPLWTVIPLCAHLSAPIEATGREHRQPRLGRFFIHPSIRLRD
jgi:hypothetical protein